jgi:aryl-alcohol dehydrogenase-like predicted oxidoreductase
LLGINLIDTADSYCDEGGINAQWTGPLVTAGASRAPDSAGSLIQPGKLLDSLCRKLGSTPGQIAIAWLLKHSPVILPIPGTSKQSHLEQNVDALDLHLSDEDYVAIDTLVQGG